MSPLLANGIRRKVVRGADCTRQTLQRQGRQWSRATDAQDSLTEWWPRECSVHLVGSAGSGVQRDKPTVVALLFTDLLRLAALLPLSLPPRTLFDCWHFLEWTLAQSHVGQFVQLSLVELINTTLITPFISVIDSAQPLAEVAMSSSSGISIYIVNNFAKSIGHLMQRCCRLIIVPFLEH